MGVKVASLVNMITDRADLISKIDDKKVRAKEISY